MKKVIVSLGLTVGAICLLTIGGVASMLAFNAGEAFFWWLVR
jgi:hypothetical protein